MILLAIEVDITKHPILSRIVRGFATIFPAEDLFRENTDCILINLLGKNSSIIETMQWNDLTFFMTFFINQEII